MSLVAQAWEWHHWLLLIEDNFVTWPRLKAKEARKRSAVGQACAFFYNRNLGGFWGAASNLCPCSLIQMGLNPPFIGSHSTTNLTSFVLVKDTILYFVIILLILPH